jgi:hypothetical protein
VRTHQIDHIIPTRHLIEGIWSGFHFVVLMEVGHWS